MRFNLGAKKSLPFALYPGKRIAAPFSYEILSYGRELPINKGNLSIPYGSPVTFHSVGKGDVMQVAVPTIENPYIIGIAIMPEAPGDTGKFFSDMKKPAGEVDLESFCYQPGDSVLVLTRGAISVLSVLSEWRINDVPRYFNGHPSASGEQPAGRAGIYTDLTNKKSTNSLVTSKYLSFDEPPPFFCKHDNVSLYLHGLLFNVSSALDED